MLKPIAGDDWTATLNSYHNTVVDNLEWRDENEVKIEAWLNGSLPPPESIDSTSRKNTYSRLNDVDHDVIAKDRGFFNSFY